MLFNTYRFRKLAVMKRLFFLFFLCTLAHAQETVSLKADWFAGIDAMGHYYGVTDNTFFRFDNNSSPEYKNVSLGRISRVDLQNPLKILLFYGDFNTCVALDNQLNETQRVDFSQAVPPLNVTACGLASQNRFWIYDSLTQQLGLYDYLRNTYVFITQPLKGIIRYYSTDFNYFQWIDDRHQHYSCDVFGKIRELGPMPANDMVRFDNVKGFWYILQGILYYDDGTGNSKKVLEIADKTVKSFWVKDQILSIFTDHGITNYKISLP